MSSQRVVRIHLQALDNSIAQLTKRRRRQTVCPSDLVFIRQLRQLVVEHLEAKDGKAATRAKAKDGNSPAV